MTRPLGMKVTFVTRSELLSEAEALAENFAEIGALEAFGRLAIGEWARTDFADRMESIRRILAAGDERIAVADRQGMVDAVQAIAGTNGTVGFDVIRDIDGVSGEVFVSTKLDHVPASQLLDNVFAANWWDAFEGLRPHVVVDGQYLDVHVGLRFE